jgi:Tfp pilus assembly protein PilO
MALNTPMKVVLTVVIIILIGVGFYLLDYSGKYAEIKNLGEDLAKKDEMLKINQERVKRLPEQLAKKEALEIQLDRLIQERLPQEDAMIFVPRFIQGMEQMVAAEKQVTGDYTLEVVSITPGKLEPPATGEAAGDSKVLELFPKQPFQVNMKAKYPTVIHLLHQLAALKLKRLVTITNISLSPAVEVGPGFSPTLTVMMPVVAYLNEGKDKDKK